MSARSPAPAPKVRSRRGGAAVPLDDLDRRLLNLIQGRFPLQPRPYAAMAAVRIVPCSSVRSCGSSRIVAPCARA